MSWPFGVNASDVIAAWWAPPLRRRTVSCSPMFHDDAAGRRRLVAAIEPSGLKAAALTGTPLCCSGSSSRRVLRVRRGRWRTRPVEVPVSRRLDALRRPAGEGRGWGVVVDLGTLLPALLASGTPPDADEAVDATGR